MPSDAANYTFQELNRDGSLQCDDLAQAKQRAYQFAYQLKCMCGRATSYGYRMLHDEPKRRIEVFGDNGMHQAYQY